MPEQVEGTVNHIIYQNPENGYTVFELGVSGGKELTCVGFFQLLTEGESVTLFGRYTEHSAYGRQFRAEAYESRIPEDAESIERYLASGAVRGIGAALAARITARFGDDALRIMEEEPERLAEVKGISLRKAQEIGAQALEQITMRRAMMFLQQYGITPGMCVRIYRQYGEEIYTILRENPYRLAEDIDGIGFKTADRIAEQTGVTPDSEYRIRSGLLYTLAGAAGDGSVFLPERELLARARDLLHVDDEEILRQVTELALGRKVILKDRDTEHGRERIVYAGRFYYLELNAARMLLELDGPCETDAAEAERRLQRLRNTAEVVLEAEQEEAVRTAALRGLMILTGGPGTGKTTTINEIIRYFRSEDRRILLAAPTGRAAKRMTETTGCEASTIHRLLEISSSSEDSRLRFERNEQNPLEADVIIIDEMSMVDIVLFHALLCAVPAGTRLILVGDRDQLPSVGPGSVLRDLIRSEVFPCVRLERIFRQAETSDIVVNAHRINRGEEIRLDNRSRDFFFLEREDPAVILKHVVTLIRDKLPSYGHASSFDIQVLSPMRKGPLGVENLNRVLQQYLNPPETGKKEKSSGERIFRTGDKVMQTRNNYEMPWEIRGRFGIPVRSGTGIFNGDLGIVREVDDFSSSLTVEFDEGRTVDYPYAQLEDLEIAYAVTIHKSQGSEYPAVILPLLSGPRMLFTRNLLYTAVTRAKDCAVLLGSRQTVREMIRCESDGNRWTSLDVRIRELAALEERL